MDVMRRSQAFLFLELPWNYWTDRDILNLENVDTWTSYSAYFGHFMGIDGSLMSYLERTATRNPCMPNIYV